MEHCKQCGHTHVEACRVIIVHTVHANGDKTVSSCNCTAAALVAA